MLNICVRTKKKKRQKSAKDDRNLKIPALMGYFAQNRTLVFGTDIKMDKAFHILRITILYEYQHFTAFKIW